MNAGLELVIARVQTVHVAYCFCFTESAWCLSAAKYMHKYGGPWENNELVWLIYIIRRLSDSLTYSGYTEV